jgi:hypothetical protein
MIKSRKLGALEEEYVAIQKILETNRRKQEEKVRKIVYYNGMSCVV